MYLKTKEECKKRKHNIKMNCLLDLSDLHISDEKTNHTIQTIVCSYLKQMYKCGQNCGFTKGYQTGYIDGATDNLPLSFKK